MIDEAKIKELCAIVGETPTKDIEEALSRNRLGIEILQTCHASLDIAVMLLMADERSEYIATCREVILLAFWMGYRQGKTEAFFSNVQVGKEE